MVFFGEIGFYVTEIHEGLDEAERRGLSLDDVHRAMNVNAAGASYRLGFLALARSYPATADHAFEELVALAGCGQASK
jgi:hypothetical protein